MGCGTVIRSFADEGSENIFNGLDSDPARKTLRRPARCSAESGQLNQAVRLRDLQAPPKTRL
jgi:hypothetical protein